MTDDQTQADPDLAAYYRGLAENPDRPIGTVPARELLARTASAIAEHRNQANAVIDSVIDLLQHLADRIRDTHDHLEAGDIEAAKELLREEIQSLDAKCLTQRPAGSA